MPTSPACYACGRPVGDEHYYLVQRRYLVTRFGGEEHVDLLRVPIQGKFAGPVRLNNREIRLTDERDPWCDACYEETFDAVTG